MKLEENLYRLRKEKGLSQADVAQKLGISRQAVSRWEVGAALPTLENLRALSELFEVPMDALVLDGNSADDFTQNVESKVSILSRKWLIPAMVIVAGLLIAISIILVIVLQHTAGEGETKWTENTSKTEISVLPEDSFNFTF